MPVSMIERAVEEKYRKEYSTKYFFVTVKAREHFLKQYIIWNDVINDTPMEYLKYLRKSSEAIPYDSVAGIHKLDNHSIIYAIQINEDEFKSFIDDSTETAMEFNEKKK